MAKFGRWGNVRRPVRDGDGASRSRPVATFTSATLAADASEKFRWTNGRFSSGFEPSSGTGLGDVRTYHGDAVFLPDSFTGERRHAHFDALSRRWVGESVDLSGHPTCPSDPKSLALLMEVSEYCLEPRSPHELDPSRAREC
jgi:hypothetical protein